jgi:hypothetical protein
LKISDQDECFDKCDEDPSCAAVCLTHPDKCRFFKFGFELLTGTADSTAYIKPQVAADMSQSSMGKLNSRFPIVKLSTKFSNHFVSQDMLTPSMCFSACRIVVKCGAASFTTDPKSERNCFMFRPGEFTESHTAGVDSDLWISYKKMPELESPVLFASSLSPSTVTRKPKTTSSTTTLPTTTTTAANRNKFLFPNTLLSGFYGVHSAVSADKCFDLCDRDAVMAAASFTLPAECRLLRFGFKLLEVREDSVTYVKPEALAEISSSGKLSATLPGVMNNTRFESGQYKSVETLTPVRCFDQCKRSMRCGGASFTTDPTSLDNCFLFRTGELIEKRVQASGSDFFWISFKKVVNSMRLI